MKSHESGNKGERKIVDEVPCQDCGAPLMLLPPSTPLFDVKCSRCPFRAQVKTNRCKPKNEMFGAGWARLEKWLEEGNDIPRLILFHDWVDKHTGQRHQRIYYFPTLTMQNIRRYERSANGKRPGYKQYNYVGLWDEGVDHRLLVQS